LGAAFALWELGSADAQQGRLALGISRMEEAAAAMRGSRHRRQLARALFNLGTAYMSVGDLGRAEPTLIEGVLAFRDVKLGRHVSSTFPVLAAVALAKNDPTRAARLLGAGEQTWEASGWTPATIFVELRDRCAQQARQLLGTRSFELALAEGRGLPLEDALQEAIRPTSDAHAGLTPREVEIVGLLAGGLTNTEISERLFVSVRTVHAHLRSLYAKLGVGSRLAAVKRASDLGILPSRPSF